MWSNLDAPSFEAAIHLENRTQILASTGGELREAAAAFLEKRPPRWAVTATATATGDDSGSGTAVPGAGVTATGPAVPGGGATDSAANDSAATDDDSGLGSGAGGAAPS